MARHHNNNALIVDLYPTANDRAIPNFNPLKNHWYMRIKRIMGIFYSENYERTPKKVQTLRRIIRLYNERQKFEGDPSNYKCKDCFANLPSFRGTDNCYKSWKRKSMRQMLAYCDGCELERCGSL
jgi:hypothetical protein